jgi:Tol biopolymer transport system component
MPGLNHIAASADGRYFLVDDFRDGRLFMGCFATKRLLPFCDTGASCGSPQYTHTHPYITPDNRRVIFNSDRTGICQVYAADIPQSFLDALAAGHDLKK